MSPDTPCLQTMVLKHRLSWDYFVWIQLSTTDVQCLDTVVQRRSVSPEVSRDLKCPATPYVVWQLSVDAIIACLTILLCTLFSVYATYSGVRHSLCTPLFLVHVFWCAPFRVHAIKFGVHQKKWRAQRMAYTKTHGVHTKFGPTQWGWNIQGGQNWEPELKGATNGVGGEPEVDKDKNS